MQYHITQQKHYELILEVWFSQQIPQAYINASICTHETPHYRSSPQLTGDKKHAQALYVLSLCGA